MDYTLTRSERRLNPDGSGETEIFVCLEMDDGEEYFPFGYWLTRDEVASVLADEDAMGAVLAAAAVRGERAMADRRAAPPDPAE